MSDSFEEKMQASYERIINEYRNREKLKNMFNEEIDYKCN